MKSFTLAGEGIEVRYSAESGVLSVQGNGLPSNNQEFFGGDLAISTSNLVTMLTGVLLASTRNVAPSGCPCWFLLGCESSTKPRSPGRP